MTALLNRVLVALPTMLVVTCTLTYLIGGPGDLVWLWGWHGDSLSGC